jgi:anti-sigma-K factor RskA
MSTPHTQPLEELLPAYALGALDGEDLRAFEEHLAGGCDECRRQLALWQGDLETLAAEIPPVQPAETTRARVLRQAGGTPAAIPAARPRRTPPWWMAAAAVLLLAFAVWGLAGRARMAGEVRRLASERDRLSRRVEALSQEVTRARTDAERAALALQVLNAPSVQAVSLAGQGPAPGAAGRTYVNPRTRDALFYAFDLPRLPDEKTYQLWFIAAGKPVSAGTFAVDPRGAASLRIERIADVRSIQAWAVTIEPRGGVPQPTGAFVLKG